MKFPTPNYRGLETAPGFVVVASDFRWTRAFPVLYPAVRAAGQAAYKRWKKTPPQILSWERFDPRNHVTPEEIDTWVRQTRHKVMHRDETKVD